MGFVIRQNVHPLTSTYQRNFIKIVASSSSNHCSQTHSWILSTYFCLQFFNYFKGNFFFISFHDSCLLCQFKSDLHHDATISGCRKCARLGACSFFLRSGMYPGELNSRCQCAGAHVHAYKCQRIQMQMKF